MTVSRRTRSKYGNKKVEEDGYTFDSTAENKFYHQVKSEMQDGNIIEFDLHPRLEILPSLKKFGRTIRPASYSPDFCLTYGDGRIEYVEVKGHKAIISEASGLRMKVFEHAHIDKRLRLWTPKTGFLT